MWTVVKVQDTEEILRGVLDRWKAGIDAQKPERVAEVFTEDAIFQGLHPYSVGRQGVIDYYASQTPGMTVTYRVLETRRPATDLVLGYVQADFAFPDRPTVSVYLGVLVKDDNGWNIVHYQASRLD
jgi:uncharacterized protein (TIGR02246 family)